MSDTPLGTPPVAPDMTLHASAVCWRGAGLLILGASGRGKSSLALQLMAYGCALISDDQTILRARNGQLIAHAPTTILGRIEARGIGILAADTAPPTPIVMVVDTDHNEETRIPPRRSISYIGVELPMVYATSHPALAAALLQLLKAGGIKYDSE